MKVLVYYPSYKYSLDTMIKMMGVTFCPSGQEPPIDFAWLKVNAKCDVFMLDGMVENVLNVNVADYDIVVLAERFSRYRCYPPYPSDDLLKIIEKCKKEKVVVVNSTGFDLDCDVNVGIGFHRILSFLNKKYYDLDFNSLDFDLSVIDYTKYFQNELLTGLMGGYFGIWFSVIGCKYRCVFCTINKFLNDTILFLNYDVFEKGLRQLKNSKVKKLYLIDETFTARKDLRKICSILSKFDFDWEIQTRIDAVNEDVLKMLKDSGCVEVGYGVEHVNSDILKNSRKYYDKKLVRNNLMLTKKVGLNTVMFAVLFLPGETLETLKELKDFVLSIENLDGSGGQIATPLKGSELYYRGVMSGLIKNDEDIVINAGRIGNEYFSVEDIKRLWYDYDRIAIPSFLELFDRYYLPGIKKEFLRRYNIL